MTIVQPLEHFDGLTLNLELLPYCNFRCPYCYERKKAKFGSVWSLSKLKYLKNSLKHSPYEIKLCLMGGEPMFYPHLKECLELFDYRLVIYTNGSVSFPEYFKSFPNLHVILSYHPSENNVNFITNVKWLIENNVSCEINLLMLRKYADKLREIEDRFFDTVPIFPTYLYVPTSEYTCTMRKNVQSCGLKCEKIECYSYNDKPVNKIFVLENNDFYGWNCVQSRLCINNMGNVCVGCGKAVTNIFKDFDFFKRFRIVPKICESNQCVKDMFLQQVKYVIL